MTYPGVDPALDPDRAAVEQRRKEREEEFGTYVATQDIPWGTVLAFVPGDQVPKSTVERLGWLDLGLVKKTGTQDTTEARATGTAATITSSGTMPAKNASKDAWVDYAVGRGAERAEVEALTRDELVAQYQTEA